MSYKYFNIIEKIFPNVYENDYHEVGETRYNSINNSIKFILYNDWIDVDSLVKLREIFPNPHTITISDNRYEGGLYIVIHGVNFG